MPESGWRQMRQTRSAIAASRRPVSRSSPPARLRVDQSGLQQVAVDVELGLRRGVVADPDRARAAVAVQLERALWRALAAVEAVEDLQARVGQLRRVQQPPEERLGLARAAQLQERLEREGRVAHPAEAVVPVALAADLLGQRRRGRCRDRPGGSVEEQLERQGAADHGVAPRALVGALRRPAAPVRGRRLQAAPRPARGSGRRVAPGGRRTARSTPIRTRSQLEAPEDRVFVDLRPRRRPRSRPPARRGPPSATGTPPRRSSRVGDGGRSRSAGVTRQRIGTRPATPSTRRISSRVGPRSWPGNAIASVTRTTPCAGGERGLQDVGVGQIAALHLRGDLGRQREAPPAIGVQDAANTLGESRSGRHSQSIDPSRATSATVRPSPIAA